MFTQLGQLFELLQSMTKIYEDLKAQAKLNGTLTDADEVALHAKEDAAMQSHPWKRDDEGGL